jgi:HTH-type transcriptional regulator / antitoxin HigA
MQTKPNKVKVSKEKQSAKKLQTKTLLKRWETFNKVAAPIFQPITNEQEYLESLELLDTISDQMTTPDDMRYIGILRLLCERVADWEKVHEAPYFQETPGYVTLKYLMQEHQVSQYQLEKEGLVNQSLLSKILSGKRSISKDLAKRLAKRFHISPVVFL